MGGLVGVRTCYPLVLLSLVPEPTPVPWGGLLLLLPSFLHSCQLCRLSLITRQETCGPVDAIEEDEEEGEDDEKDVVHFPPELFLPLLAQLALFVRQLVHPPRAPQRRLPHRLLLPPQLKFDIL